MSYKALFKGGRTNTARSRSKQPQARAPVVDRLEKDRLSIAFDHYANSEVLAMALWAVLVNAPAHVRASTSTRRTSAMAR